MGIGICISDGTECPCWNDDEECLICQENEIWQSSYSTYSKFRRDANIAYSEIRWPDRFKENGEEWWKYEKGMQLAQDLKIALLNEDFSNKWGYKTLEFIKGLERAYGLELNLILC